MSDAARERIVRWADPLQTAATLRTMPGLAALRALMAGEVDAPPIAHLIGFSITHAESGVVSASLVPNESHYNPIGMVHGGVIATLLDTVVGCAVQSMLPLSRGYTTLNLSVSYIRAVTLATGEIMAEGTIMHSGRSTAIAHGRVRDAAGKLLATAETTCLLFDLPAKK